MKSDIKCPICKEYLDIQYSFKTRKGATEPNYHKCKNQFCFNCGIDYSPIRKQFRKLSENGDFSNYYDAF